MVFDISGYYKRFLNGTQLSFPKMFWNTFYSTISFYCDYGKVIEKDYNLNDCQYRKLTKDIVVISVNDVFGEFFNGMDSEKLGNLKVHLKEVLEEYFGNVINLSELEIVLSFNKCVKIQNGISVNGFELMEALGEVFRVAWVKAEITRYFERLEGK